MARMDWIFIKVGKKPLWIDGPRHHAPNDQVGKGVHDPHHHKNGGIAKPLDHETCHPGKQSASQSRSEGEDSRRSADHLFWEDIVCKRVLIRLPHHVGKGHRTDEGNGESARGGVMNCEGEGHHEGAWNHHRHSGGDG